MTRLLKRQLDKPGLIEAADIEFDDPVEGAWAYKADANGILHRWFAAQPPVILAGGSGADIVAGSSIQVPQSDFVSEWLLEADDYSDGDQGLGGQYITTGSLRAWGARLEPSGAVRVYVSDDGVAALSAITARTVYAARVVDGEKCRIKAEWRHLGSTIEVDIYAARQRFGESRHTTQPAWLLLDTLAFTYANLVDLSVPVHLGSRYRTGTGSGDGRECLTGVVESMSISVGGEVVARFPNAVAGNTWSTSGTALANPSTYTDEPYREVPNGYYDVTVYGAVGNGTADDTASIQAAIEACYAAGGGVVFVPPSATPYMVSDAIEVPESVWLDGVGGFWSNYGATTDRGSVIKLLGSSTLATGVGILSLVVRDVGNVDNRHFGGVRHLTVHGNKGSNTFGCGVSSIGTRFATVSFVSAVYCAEHGIRAVSEGALPTNDIWLDHVFAGWNDLAGFSLAGGDSEAVNCIAGVNGSNGFTISTGRTQFVGCHSWNNDVDGFYLSASGDDAHGNLFSGCHAYDNDRAGFYLGDATGTLIAGCSGENNGFDATEPAHLRAGLVFASKTTGSTTHHRNHVAACQFGNLTDRGTEQQYGISLLDADSAVEISATALVDNTIAATYEVSGARLFRHGPFGTTAQRPSPDSTAFGLVYFDTDLGQPIWWDGTGWVDATGADPDA